MTETNSQVIVIKMTPAHQEVWRYEGKVLSRGEHSLLLEARFNRSDLPFHGITLRENDRFLERYYEDRWYNIYEIHDREDDHLKGWYCNVTAPTEFSPGQIVYVDLALDLLAFPDGRFLTLDEDEFEELALDELTRQQALNGLEALIHLAKTGGLATAIH